jgi:hypothetical protein
MILRTVIRLIFSFTLGVLFFFLFTAMSLGVRPALGLAGVAVIFFFLHLRVQEKEILSQSKKITILEGGIGALQLDSVIVKVEPEWTKTKNKSEELYLKGSVLWQGSPINKNKQLDEIGFPIRYIYPGYEEDIDWIAAYIPSGKRYLYKLYIKYEIEPEPKLTVVLEKVRTLSYL